MEELKIEQYKLANWLKLDIEFYRHYHEYKDEKH